GASSCTFLKPARPRLFPYTTLFRSPVHQADREDRGLRGPEDPLLGRVHPGDVAGARRDARKPDDAGHVRIAPARHGGLRLLAARDRKSTRLNSSHVKISYAVFCLKK